MLLLQLLLLQLLLLQLLLLQLLLLLLLLLLLQLSELLFLAKLLDFTLFLLVFKGYQLVLHGHGKAWVKLEARRKALHLHLLVLWHRRRLEYSFPTPNPTSRELHLCRQEL